MEETDIIICLKKRNKHEKNIREIIVRLKSIFHRCKRSINIKDIDIDMVIKVHFKIAITKILFIIASINF